MDKETFDIAMKLNHGRTVREGDNVCLKKDDNRDELFNIISIFTKEVYMKKYNIETFEEFIENQKNNRGNKKIAIQFDEFLIRFKKFNRRGRK